MGAPTRRHLGEEGNEPIHAASGGGGESSESREHCQKEALGRRCMYAREGCSRGQTLPSVCEAGRGDCRRLRWKKLLGFIDSNACTSHIGHEHLGVEGAVSQCSSGAPWAVGF
jgi:hypothetical protein